MDETLRKALEALKGICDEQDAMQGYASCEAYDKARAAIAAIEQHKTVVRMLTEQELDVMYIMYSQADSPSHQDWEQAVQREFAEKNGLTIGEHG